MRVLSLDSNLKTTGIAYGQVFETDAPEERLKDEQLRHKQVMDKISLWSRGRKTSLRGQKNAVVGADDYVGYLLRMTIMLSTDHVTGLSDPEAVEALQLANIRRLQRYLKHKFNSRAELALAESLDMMSLTREAHHLSMTLRGKH